MRLKKLKCLVFLAKELKIRTKWWVLMMMIIDSNILRLAFNISVQLRSPFSFDIFNKLNLIIAVLVWFVVIFFSIAFLPLLYVFAKQKIS